MTTKFIEAYETVNANIRKPITFDLNQAASSTAGNGSVPSAVSAQVVATESGDGVIHQTLLTLTALAQAIADATSWQGTKIYDFPAGRIHVLGVTATLTPTTT